MTCAGGDAEDAREVVAPVELGPARRDSPIRAKNHHLGSKDRDPAVRRRGGPGRGTHGPDRQHQDEPARQEVELEEFQQRFSCPATNTTRASEATRVARKRRHTLAMSREVIRVFLAMSERVAGC